MAALRGRKRREAQLNSFHFRPGAPRKKSRPQKFHRRIRANLGKGNLKASLRQLGLVRIIDLYPRSRMLSDAHPRRLGDADLAPIKAGISKRQARLLDDLLRKYQEMAIPEAMRFKDKLMAQQKEAFHPVEAPEDWRAIREAFLEEVHEAKAVSFDTEGLNQGSSLHYAIFATFVGTTLVVDIDRYAAAMGREVARGAPAQRTAPPTQLEDRFCCIPHELRDLLVDPDITVVGRDLQADSRATASRITSAADVGQIFRAYRGYGAAGLPKVVDIHGATPDQDGLWIQTWWAKGESSKTMTQAKYVRHFGPHGYTGGWPRHRTWRLYDWRRALGGRFAEEVRWYLYHDATAPFSLAYCALLGLAIYFGVLPGDEDSIGAMVGGFFRVFAHGTYDHRDASSAAPSRIYTEEENPRRRKDAPEDLPDEIPASDEVLQRLKGRKRARQAGPAAAREVRPRLQDRGGDDGQGAPHKEEVDPEAWAKRPTLAGACSTCGADDHTSRDRKGRARCGHLNDRHPKRRLCDYRFCSRPESHVTRVCPRLHRRCDRCGARGHTERSRCTSWGLKDWEASRNTWEEVADQGCLTARRHGTWQWGFLGPGPRARSAPLNRSYAELRAMPVQKALGLIHGIEVDWGPETITPAPAAASITTTSTGRRTESALNSKFVQDTIRWTEEVLAINVTDSSESESDGAGPRGHKGRRGGNPAPDDGHEDGGEEAGDRAPTDRGAKKKRRRRHRRPRRLRRGGKRTARALINYARYGRAPPDSMLNPSSRRARTNAGDEDDDDVLIIDWDGAQWD